MSKASILYLIIYILFSTGVVSQNLRLEITGENDFETQNIDSLSYEYFHKDLNSINSEIDSLQQRLFRIGFIESSHEDVNRVNDSVYESHFRLGTQFQKIHIYYDEQLITKNVISDIVNDVYDDHFLVEFKNIEQTMKLINARISDLGFPFSELKLQNISKLDERNLIAYLSSSDNTEQRNINKIIIKGYEKFPKSFLKHYLKIRTDRILNLSEIKEKTKSLSELNFANQIKEPEVLFTRDSTILYLYLEKSRSNSFDGFLGFGTNENTNKIEFNGYLNLILKNNLNFGEAFSLKYRSDENEQRTFDVNLNLPYLLSTPLGVELGLNIFRKDSSFTNVNQMAKLFYQVNPKMNVYLGINSTKSNNLLDDDNAVAEIQDYDATKYTVRFSYIKRQNSRLFNTNLLFDIELGLGDRRFAERDENQSQVLLNAFKIFNLNRKNSIYVRLNGAGLFSETYLENELFRYGGINSLRGFEENSIVGSLYGLINTEYRYHLTNSIYVHSIIDFSYLENKRLSQKEKLYGFGFGFGLLTKAGLLRFNYANGKSEDQKFKFSDSKIHLSLTAVF